MKDELLAEPEGSVAGVPVGIDVNKPPNIFRDAMSREDGQEWAEAYDSEYQGFLKHGALQLVWPEQGAKVIGTTTRTEYKVTNGVFKKHKVLLCVMGNQLKERKRALPAGGTVCSSDEGSRGATIRGNCGKASAQLVQVWHRQAFLIGDISEEKTYVRPPDWWPKHRL